MAVKLFGEIARAQASSRHPVGHVLRRLIDTNCGGLCILLLPSLLPFLMGL
jgi:hypothetical protein